MRVFPYVLMWEHRLPSYTGVLSNKSTWLSQESSCECAGRVVRIREVFGE